MCRGGGRPAGEWPTLAAARTPERRTERRLREASRTPPGAGAPLRLDLERLTLEPEARMEQDEGVPLAEQRLVQARQEDAALQGAAAAAAPARPTLGGAAVRPQPWPLPPAPAASGARPRATRPRVAPAPLPDEPRAPPAGTWRLSAPGCRTKSACATCLSPLEPREPRLSQGMARARVHHVRCKGALAGHPRQLYGWGALGEKQQVQALADYDLVAPPPPPAADAAMGQPAAGTHSVDGDPGMPATAPEVNNPVVDDTDQLLEGTDDLTDHTLENMSFGTRCSGSRSTSPPGPWTRCQHTSSMLLPSFVAHWRQVRPAREARQTVPWRTQKRWCLLINSSLR